MRRTTKRRTISLLPLSLLCLGLGSCNDVPLGNDVDARGSADVASTTTKDSASTTTKDSASTTTKDSGGQGACTSSDCPAPAPGAPNVLCSDGKTIGGPACERSDTGQCAWVIVSCPVPDAAPDAPVVSGDSGGQGACTSQECPSPAPGTPNILCSDGKTVGGPVCERSTTGQCAWVIVSCPVPDAAPDTPAIAGDSGGQGACASSECPSPAPTAPTVLCSDGTIGGPVCERNTTGQCAWFIVSCPVTPPGLDGGKSVVDSGQSDGSAGAGDAASTHWYQTCGDPVCRPPTDAGSGAPPCTTQKVGDPCAASSSSCDPGLGCGVLLACMTKAPTACPISRREYKQDIQYLGDESLAKYRSELLGMKLATWRYKHDPSRERLGFIIDDSEGSVAVEGTGNQVDLYGYTSLAVATLQLQAKQIAALESEVASLKSALANKRPLRAATSSFHSSSVHQK